MFEVTTEYDQRAMLAMNRAANKTFRRGKYLFHKIFQIVLGLWCLLGGGVLLLVFDKLDTGERVITAVALVIGAFSLFKGLFYNRLSARASRKMMVEGADRWTVRFDGEGLSGGTAEGVQSAYPYAKVRGVYETAEYFLLQIDKLHCVILDKDGFTQGTCEEFRRFITEKTGTELRTVNV